MFNNLSQSVYKAQMQHANMNDYEIDQMRADESVAIKQYKTQLDRLVKDYITNSKEQNIENETNLTVFEKQKRFEDKVEAIKNIKFQDEVINQAISRKLHRDAQQYRNCKEIYQLVANLEKEKHIDERDILKKLKSEEEKKAQAKINSLES